MPTSRTAAPAQPAVAPLPIVGYPAPFCPELNLPRSKPTLVVFLRQCGDPFAEKTFRNLAALSEDRPELLCIAVTQARRDITDSWIAGVGGAWETEVVTDPKRNIYADWGLGLNTSWQMFNPRALYATYALGRDEGIWSRAWGGQKKMAVSQPPPPAEGDETPDSSSDSASGNSPMGNKWQMGGAFAVDTTGYVRWVHVPKASEDVPDFNPVLELFGMPPLRPKHKKRAASPAPVPIPDNQPALYQTPTPR